MHAVKAGIAYFGLAFGAGFVLGALRVTFLVPRVGVRLAELIEMPIMLVVIVLSARFVVRRFLPRPAATARLATGVVALALLVAAELLLAGLVQGQSVPAYIASRDPVSGSVYLAMLAVFAVMPLLVARLPSDRLPSGFRR